MSKNVTNKGTENLTIHEIEISDRDFDIFGSYLKKTLDINIVYLKKAHVLRRIKARMIKTSSNTITAYLNLIKSTDEEKREIKSAFSVNVTHFFRNPDTFEEIKKSVFPMFIHNKSINIWSAGCADGAEPYTLAILLKSLNINSAKARILASDYNLKSLEMAKKSDYPSDYLKETPEVYKKYFKKHGVNKHLITIDSSLRRFIDFKMHNLLNEQLVPKIGKNKFDLILCRNVMIYFDKNHQDMVYQKFYDALRPGGYLVIGRSEILLGKWRQKFETFDANHRISRKIIENSE